MRNILTLLAVLLLLCSCRTVREYVPIESTDTITRYMERTDTVIDRDTVHITQSGDTVVIETTKWRWRIRNKIDTVKSVSERKVPYPVKEYVEVNRLHWWQSALMWLGGIATLVLVLLSLFHKFK